MWNQYQALQMAPLSMHVHAVYIKTQGRHGSLGLPTYVFAQKTINFHIAKKRVDICDASIPTSVTNLHTFSVEFTPFLLRYHDKKTQNHNKDAANKEAANKTTPC